MRWMLILVIAGICIVISSEGWPGIWLGMELNSYFFLGMLTEKSRFQFKYFFIQTLGTIFFLFSFLFLSDFLYIISMMMKMSACPFFFWVYPHLKVLPNMTMALFMTLQKIIPLYLLLDMTLNFSNTAVLTLFFFINSVSGYLGVINKTVMIDIVLFSSIYQISWLIMMMMLSKYLFKFYFMFYMIIIFFIILMLKKDLMSHNHKSGFVYMWLYFLIVSGFPPSLIFLLKINVILSLWSVFSFILVMFNLVLAVGFMFNYLSLIYTSIHNKMGMIVWHNSDVWLSVCAFLLLILAIMAM